MEASVSSTADLTRRKTYLAVVLVVGALVVIFLGAILSGLIKHEMVGQYVRGWLGGMVALIGYLIWARSFPPPLPPMMAKLSAEDGYLVRQWTDEKGRELEDRKPLRDLQRVVDWVGAEDGFLEFIWRDGSRWPLKDGFAPVGPGIAEFWQSEMIGERIERLGIVLRKGDTELEPRSVAQA